MTARLDPSLRLADLPPSHLEQILDQLGLLSLGLTTYHLLDVEADPDMLQHVVDVIRTLASLPRGRVASMRLDPEWQDVKVNLQLRFVRWGPYYWCIQAQTRRHVGGTIGADFWHLQAAVTLGSNWSEIASGVRARWNQTTYRIEFDYDIEPTA